MIEQAKFTYFRKQLKAIEEQAEKQIKAVESRVVKQLLDTDLKSITSLFSKYFLTEEVRYELNIILEIEQKFNRDDLIHKTDDKKKDKTYDF